MPNFILTLTVMPDTSQPDKKEFVLNSSSTNVVKCSQLCYTFFSWIQNAQHEHSHFVFMVRVLMDHSNLTAMEI